MDNSPYYHNTAIMNHYLNYYIPPGISMTGYYPGNYGNSLGPVNTIGFSPAAFQRYLPYQNPQRAQTTSSLIFYDPRTVSGEKYHNMHFLKKNDVNFKIIVRAYWLCRIHAWVLKGTNI